MSEVTKEYKEAYDEYIKARDRFWEVRDKMVKKSDTSQKIVSTKLLQKIAKFIEKTSAGPFMEGEKEEEYGKDWADFIKMKEGDDEFNLWKNKLKEALLEDRSRNSDIDFDTWAESLVYDNPSDDVANLLDEGFEKYDEDKAHDAMIEIMDQLAED